MESEKVLEKNEPKVCISVSSVHTESSKNPEKIEMCYTKSEIKDMMQKIIVNSNERKAKIIIYLTAIYNKYIIAFGLAVLLSLALFTYGNDGWAIARFMAFAVICIVLINFIILLAPIVLIFSTQLYVFLINIADLNSTLLTSITYIITLVIGTLGFIILILQSGFIQGWISHSIAKSVTKQ